MEKGSEPRLSLVIPTVGNGASVIRLLKSLINGFPKDMLSETELIIYLNRLPHIAVDVVEMQRYLELVRPSFNDVQFHASNVSHLTAEESACAAVEKATGRYLWIAGDKRIFLPEGLQQLARFLGEDSSPCAYFNSVWQERDGFTNAIGSSHFSRRETEMPYKLLVQKVGANYMATAMGTWVFHRKLLDVDLWKHLILTCGPHFSHVFVLLAKMENIHTRCYAVFLSIIEAKPYHSGNFTEWAKYSELSKTYRYFAWTLGMTRLYNYVIKNGHFSYLDLRRSVCVEGRYFGRQVDEIYNNFFEQIKLGWTNERERLSFEEFDEIHTLLLLACPERAIVNGLIEKFYHQTCNEPSKNVEKTAKLVYSAINSDYTGIRFASLIIGQVADRFIRLHPQGYVLSYARDDQKFEAAYRLLDPPTVHDGWEILDDEQLFEADWFENSQKSIDLFPPKLDRSALENFGSKLPVWLELELAKLLCTLGRRSVGDPLWNHATSRKRLR